MVDIECDNSRMDNLTKLLQRQMSCLSLHDYDQGDAFPEESPQSISTQESFGKCVCVCVDFPSLASQINKISLLIVFSHLVLYVY